MSGEARISEREAVMRERAAFQAGAMHQEVKHRASLRCFVSAGLLGVRDEIAMRYPLPKVERPRIARVAENEYYDEPIGPREFRLINGAFEHRDKVTGWKWEPTDRYDWDLDVEVVAALAALLAKPTEMVDDDGEPDPGVSS